MGEWEGTVGGLGVGRGTGGWVGVSVGELCLGVLFVIGTGGVFG